MGKEESTVETIISRKEKRKRRKGRRKEGGEGWYLNSAMEKTKIKSKKKMKSFDRNSSVNDR